MFDLHAIFRAAGALEASDVHLRSGQTPRVRVDGEVTVLEGMPAPSEADLARTVEKLLTDVQRQRLASDGEVDCACVDERGTRYRANFFRDAGGLSAAMRRIDARIRTLAELGLPRGHVYETMRNDEAGGEGSRVHVEMTGDLPGAEARRP